VADGMDNFKNAMKLFGEERYPEAIVEYQRALDEQPEWTDAMLGLGVAQMNDGRFDDCIATCMKILELDGDHAFAHSTLSMCYQRKGMIPEAEQWQAKARMISWREELKNNPNAPPPTAPGGGHGQ